jgi:hypothetical protein
MGAPFVFGSKRNYAKRKRNSFRFEAKEKLLFRLFCFEAKQWISYGKRKGSEAKRIEAKRNKRSEAKKSGKPHTFKRNEGKTASTTEAKHGEKKITGAKNEAERKIRKR